MPTRHSLPSRTSRLLATVAALVAVLASVAVPAGAETASPVWADAARVASLWDAGLDGHDVGIALLDTGVAEHPDLDAVVHHDVTGNGGDDGFGHGTVMAGLLVGDGTASDGRHRGVAPGATLHSIRVADDDGQVRPAHLHAGLKRAAALGRSGRVDVVVLGFGVDASDGVTDPLEAAVQQLTADGLLVAVSSGNDRLTSPATSPAALAVGALDDAGTADPADDTTASFTVTGQGDGDTVRPDLLAPGVAVAGTVDPDSQLARDNPDAVLDGVYLRGSGTSQAAALAAGVAALLLQDDPAASPADVSARLADTARTVPGGQTLDAAAAAASTLDVVEPTADDMTWLGSGPRGSGRAGFGWGGSSWAGSSWGGSSWGGSSWGGSSWGGFSWDGSSWGGFAWGGSSWSSSSWDTGTTDHPAA